MPGGLDDPEYLAELFAAFGPVTVQRMFGGAGVYRDGTMFALVADEVLYLKADATSSAAFTAEGCGPFVYDGKGKPVTMSYWRLPDRLYDDPEELAQWARAALEVARRGKAGAAARGPMAARGRAPKPGPRAR